MPVKKAKQQPQPKPQTTVTTDALVKRLNRRLFKTWEHDGFAPEVIKIYGYYHFLKWGDRLNGHFQLGVRVGVGGMGTENGRTGG
jgi:hypothetical protein